MGKGSEPASNMWTFIARRIVTTIPVIVLISLITFLAIRTLPGDPARSMLGPEADPAAVEALRKELGWDQNILVQYLDWVGGAVRGDFGTSFRSGEPVTALVQDRLAVSVQLGLMSLVIALVVAIPLGILAGSHPNTPLDYVSTFFAVLGAAVPNFWLAMMLVLVFSVQLGWFPALGWTPLFDDPIRNLKSLALPAISLGVFQAAVLTRMTRAAMVDVLRQDYVRTARAKGLHEKAVIVRHAFRNALVPVVTVLGLQISTVVGGAIIIETVFALPGVGKLLIDSILFRELVTIQALALMIAAAVAGANLLVDVAYAYLDPRIRYG